MTESWSRVHEEAAQQAIETVAAGGPLADVLELLCRTMEDGSSDRVIACIHPLDDDAAIFRDTAAPSLDQSYAAAVNGMLVSSLTGPCCYAVTTRQTIVVPEVAADPKWSGFRAFADPLGVRSCWSTPIFSNDGRVLGTFAHYYFEARDPSPRDERMVELLTRAAAIAIERSRADAALHRSEQQFRTLANSIPQLAWMADAAGSIVWYNQRWYDYTGTTLDEMEESGWRKVHHPDEVARVDASIQKAFETGEPWEDTFPLRARDGAYRWFLSRALPIRDQEGHIARWFGTHTDITTQREMERALRRSGEELEARVAERTSELSRQKEQLSLVQTIGLEVAAARDLSEAMEVVLRRVCESTGWELGEAWLPRSDGGALTLGSSWLQGHDLEAFQRVSAGSEFSAGIGLPGRVWASKKPAWVQDVTLDLNFLRAEAAAEAGLKAALAIPLLSGDDVIAVIEFFLREPRAKDEQLVELITAVAAQLSMVIERKRAEDALRESEARFRVVADHAPVLLWMSGPDRRFIFFNRGWLHFTGRSMDEELGDGWMHGVHPDDVVRRLEVYTASFDARQEFTIEYRLRRWDGEFRWILDCGIPRFGSGNELLGYIGSCVDITDRRRAEEADQRMAQASRLTVMGELTASIAHEINQPLVTIGLMAEACERWLAGPAPSLDEARECLAGISAATDRVREVISRVRTLTKKATAKSEPLQINEVIEQALSIARHELLARQTPVRMELSPALPAVTADRIQLQQVLLNLIVNAVQAMVAVPPERRRLVIQSSLDDDTVVVEVRDTGPGLPAEVQARLFTPFFTTKAEGLGLGLSITQSIIEAHGGRIGIVPGAGGATFRFELPPVAARTV